MIRLYAFHLLNKISASKEMGLAYPQLSDYIETQKDTSPYASQFSRDYAYFEIEESKKASIPWWLPVLLFSGLIAISIYFWRQSKKDTVVQSNENGAQLSRREQKVLSLLKEGKTNKEISQELHIEVSTVKSHVHKIYSKLGVKGRKELLV